MTQEDKYLLLKDICPRLPYRVKVKITSEESKNRIVYLTENNICHLTNGWWSECKPYLFPFSSMTEEQWKEITDIQIKESLKSIDSNNDYMSNPLFSTVDLKTLDWCYTNHIDYRGLIPMGLAIDATGLNIY